MSFGRRGLAGVAAASALLVAAAACGGSGGGSSAGGKTKQSGSTNGGTQNAQAGGTLNMLGSGDVDYMDPNISYYSIGYLGMRPWSRQLYSYPAVAGQTTTAKPDLATGDPQVSSDGKTVTITMRTDAMWNTNPPRPVTAQDLIRGVKRTCNPAQPFGGLPDYQDLIVGFTSFCSGFSKVSATSASKISSYLEGHNIQGMTAKDDHTIVFTLTHPASYFKDMLTLTAFSPAPKEYDQYIPASSQLAQHTISDGPYAIQSYNPTKQIVFARNTAWKASSDPLRKAYVDKIVINETVSQASTQQQLETGTPSADMEFDNFPPPSRIPALRAQKDPNFTTGETASSNPYLVFNFKSPNNNGAMQKLPFRQAIEYSINRSNLIQALGGPSINQALTHVLPSDIVGGEQNFDLYPFNASKAKSMLSQSGVSSPTIKILYRTASEGSSKVFANAQQALTQAGFKVQGVGVPNADFYTKYLEVPSVASRGVWDIAVAGWGADWYGNAALSYFEPLFSGSTSFPPNGSNFGFYSNPATTNLINQAVSATTQSQAANLWHQADMQVMKDAAFYPITNPLQPNYHSKNLHNTVYVPNFQNYDPTNVWITKSAQGG